LRYFSRGRQAESLRSVSPQRLTHWRNTWYLDAWCHASDGLRRFALDAVREARLLNEPALDMPLAALEAELDAGYGAYTGSQVQWATLWFSAEAAQWVAHEQWHPKQQLKRRKDGSLELRLPYTDPTELAMDLLRHGDQAEVLGPPALRQWVAQRLQAAALRYAAS
jgi:predicted DNA-binding transcriptional regulator YafY